MKKRLRIIVSFCALFLLSTTAPVLAASAPAQAPANQTAKTIVTADAVHRLIIHRINWLDKLEGQVEASQMTTDHKAKLKGDMEKAKHELKTTYTDRLKQHKNNPKKLVQDEHDVRFDFDVFSLVRSRVDLVKYADKLTKKSDDFDKQTVARLTTKINKQKTPDSDAQAAYDRMQAESAKSRQQTNDAVAMIIDVTPAEYNTTKHDVLKQSLELLNGTKDGKKDATADNAKANLQAAIKDSKIVTAALKKEPAAPPMTNSGGDQTSTVGPGSDDGTVSGDTSEPPVNDPPVGPTISGSSNSYNGNPPEKHRYTEAELANKATMTPRTRKAYSRTKPQLINSRAILTDKCGQAEGCFIPKHVVSIKVVNGSIKEKTVGDKIYLKRYKIERQGYEVAIAAHETLHEVYEQYNAKQREKVDTMLANFYNKHRQPGLDEALRINYEKKDYKNELHSYIGSQFRTTNPEIERYYKHFFKDRQNIIRELATADKSFYPGGNYSLVFN
jgi:hypothetical protein